MTATKASVRCGETESGTPQPSPRVPKSGGIQNSEPLAPPCYSLQVRTSVHQPLQMWASPCFHLEDQRRQDTISSTQISFSTCYAAVGLGPGQFERRKQSTLGSGPILPIVRGITTTESSSPTRVPISPPVPPSPVPSVPEVGVNHKDTPDPQASHPTVFESLLHVASFVQGRTPPPPPEPTVIPPRQAPGTAPTTMPNIALDNLHETMRLPFYQELEAFTGRKLGEFEWIACDDILRRWSSAVKEVVKAHRQCPPNPTSQWARRQTRRGNKNGAEPSPSGALLPSISF